VNQFNASLWGDEGFSAILSMKSVPEIIRIIIKDTSPPLYNLTEHFWFGIFGTSEAAIRSLSFFYYCLAVFFVFKLVSLLWDRKTAFAAALLTFFNPFFFIYAFEGRMYSIMSLGVAASMYFYLKIWNSRKPSSFDFAGYVIATLWAIYSHHFAMFIVILQGLWWILESLTGNRKLSKKVFLSFLTIGVGYLPWVWPLYSQTKMVSGGFWLGTPSARDLVFLMGEYLAYGIKSPLSGVALVIALIILLLRIWNKKYKSTLIIALWFIFPILATWTISQFMQSIFYNRYLLYTIPGAMIILASNRRKVFSSVLIGVLLGLFIRIDYHYFTHPVKYPFRELAEYVIETKKGDDYLINWNAASHHIWETKYYGIGAPLYIPGGESLPFFVGTALMAEGDIIRELPPKINRVGVITSGEVSEIKLTGYVLAEEKHFGNLKFVWYRKF